MEIDVFLQGLVVVLGLLAGPWALGVFGRRPRSGAGTSPAPTAADARFEEHQAWLAANGVQEGAAQGVGCSWTDRNGVVHEGVEYTSTRGGSVVRELVVDPATDEWRWV